MNKIDENIQKIVDKSIKKLTENRIMFMVKKREVYEKEIRPLVSKICCAIPDCKDTHVYISSETNVEGRFDYFDYLGQIIFPIDNLYWSDRDDLKIVLILNSKKDKFETEKIKIKLKDFTIDKLIKTFEKMKNKLEKKSE